MNVKRALAIIVALLALAAVLSAPVRAETSVIPGEIILRPLPGVPAIGLPGDTIEVQPAEGVTIQELQIVSILHGPYDLKILGTEDGVVKAKIPEEVAPDVYFLIVKSDKGEVTIPNGVWVMKEAPKVLKIAQGSDFHVTSGSKMGFVCGEYFQKSIPEILKYCDDPIPMHSYTATDSFMTYYAMVDSGEVNLMVSTGDDVDTNGDKRGYQLFDLAILHGTAAGMPFIGIKGNHDHPPTYYSKYVGPRYFYEVIGNFLIIGLDSRGEERHPEMEQLHWMEDVLKSHPNKTVIVLVHHPFWYKTDEGKYGTIKGYTAFDDNDWSALMKYVSWDWAGRDGQYQDIARYFLQLVEKYNVRLILAGHIHHDKPILYIDKDGNEHWFYTLTTTGAPDKTSNPPSKADIQKGYKTPSWYGSQVIYVYPNGTVSFPEMDDVLHPGISSLPVPQKFVVLRQNGEDGTAVHFFNNLGKAVSGPLVVRIPEGAKVDPDATTITYKVIAEREIGGNYYMLLNVTVPEGESQLAVVKEKDTQKPTVEFGYISPRKPKPGTLIKVFFDANDNVGIKSAKIEVIEDGKVVATYPAFSTDPWDVKGNYFSQFTVNSSKFTLKVIVEDFYGNTAETTYEHTATTTTTTSTPSEGKGVCGPAALVAIAILPLFFRKKK
ncbi:metallophosphoesterase [Thermococcus sp. MAR1]|uniref:metallophosphoesterase n=1 Tax=Thermococcus sp. MAR1 TaxID=1638263 RepID=UPI00143C6DB9|nr:metallophosphoesterase [Thermococcus sp. MAR1]NJE10680.1 CGP-CTERM sorting domain-containing protein [Thermococcus sp. MAR1]